MSKLRLLSIAVIGLLLVNVGIVGFLILRKPPHPPEGRPPMANEGPKQFIIERLNFNAEQVTAYEKLITAHRTSIRALEGSISVLKNNLYQTFNDGSSTDKDAIVNRLGEIQKQIELTNYNHFAEIKKICRPEQLVKFNKLTIELAHFFTPVKKDAHPPKD